MFNTKSVVCPGCGKEMNLTILENEGYYECVCGWRSPPVPGFNVDAIRGVALWRDKPQNVPIEAGELAAKTMERYPVWIEWYAPHKLDAVIFQCGDSDDEDIWYASGGFERCIDMEKYNSVFRFWENLPSEKDMEAAAWKNRQNPL